MSGAGKWTSLRSPDIGERVREFYDRHPYPPPVETLEQYQQRWQDRQRRRADFHLFWPGSPYREDQSILIAGCGTSQAAKHALRWPSAEVVGIDRSGASIHHTERLKEKYRLNNLQVLQLALERVEQLDRRFDQIVCTGVLHHLEDPEIGLHALCEVLKPNGAIHLMVYAPYGRSGVYMLQEFCRRIGVCANDAGVRDLMRALRILPAGHPLQNLLSEAADFHNEAAIVDALLHPQDRAYSVPQLFELFEKTGLKFGRWLRQAPYSVHCGLMSTIPQVSQIAALPLHEQFAAVELFRGSMIRHSAIVCRNDCTVSLGAVTFAGDDWLTYVPIRMPDTICLQDQVLPGAAAVLINRTHTNKDLVLVIDATQKRLLDAIDGQRTIREIAECVYPADNRSVHLDATRGFFERLWWHDQVVFDTTSACSRQSQAPRY